MSSARSVTSAAHRMPSHAGPSPRAAGAQFHVGHGSPGQSALPPPQRIAASYPSFQPPGGWPRVDLSTMVLLDQRPCRVVAESVGLGPGQPQPTALAGNSPVYGPGWKFPLVVAQGVAGKPGLFLPGRTVYFCHSSQGCSRMTLYGYARVSVREPEDKNLDLQVERLVRAGCSLGNIRAEEASGDQERPRRPPGTAGPGGRGGHPGGHPH